MLYYENGQLKHKSNYKDDKKDGGVWLRYLTSGQLVEKTNYKNDKKEGAFLLYYDNGQLNSKGNYKMIRQMVNGLIILIMVKQGKQYEYINGKR